MPRTVEQEPRPEQAVRLKGELLALVDALSAAADPRRLDELLASARRLLQQKLAMAGTKLATRQLLEELVQDQLRNCLKPPERTDRGERAERGDPAQVVLSTLLSGTLLAEFSAAIDRAILECSAPRDYSFAGRADFISLEEVLQLLGGAKHRGRLSLEKPDNRLDIYFDNSLVAFLDPHRFVRRVMPSPNRISYREVGLDLLREADQRHAAEGVPIVVTLSQHGFFRESELRDAARVLGLEVLFDFLREQGDCAYAYRRIDQPPPFAVRYNLKLPVTPILLEGNKRLDDWRSMTKVFPNADEPLRPVENMISRIGALDLNVIEIKMLAQINGQTTPRKLSPSMGLPLPEVYQHLVRFAKAGVIVPPGGAQALDDVAMSVEESVEMAIQALDANDDRSAMTSALDRVLGGDDDHGTGGAPRPRAKG